MVSPEGLDHAFGLYVVAVAVGVSALAVAFLPRRVALGCVAALVVWLAYVQVIGSSGVAAWHAHFPPGIAILLLPVLAFVVASALLEPGRRISAAVPAWALMAVESFRVGVEMTLARLNEAGLVPHIVTLAGGNVEIVFAATAPVAAFLAYRRVGSRSVLIGWNVIGLLSLANVAARAVLTSPGPLNVIRSEVPDVGIITHPFTFVPGFMAPLAILLHLLAIRSLMGAQGGAGPAGR